MFENDYESRLREWSEFRSTLENSDNPFVDTLKLYKNAPRIFKSSVDPWDQNTWLGPWQLVEKNLYTEMCITLGICYSLQLTERFSSSNFEIHNAVDQKNKHTFYLLVVDKNVINPIAEEVYSGLPTHFVSQRIFKMPKVN
tara:strand:- start:326 stop:748 length:423 start_codon:yes stop_codon:yes gene_type:complete